MWVKTNHFILTGIDYSFCIRVDIDECSDNLNSCDMNAVCSDSVGSLWL